MIPSICMFLLLCLLSYETSLIDLLIRGIKVALACYLEVYQSVLRHQCLLIQGRTLPEYEQIWKFKILFVNVLWSMVVFNSLKLFSSWLPPPETKPRLFDFVTFHFFSVRSIGCFRDTHRRAVPQMDGRNPLVKDYYRRRKDAILKCALVAMRFGYRVFAVQHQGWCATGPRAHVTYRKYGRSNRCRSGKGGPWANDVYIVNGMWSKIYS